MSQHSRFVREIWLKTKGGKILDHRHQFLTTTTIWRRRISRVQTKKPLSFCAQSMTWTFNFHFRRILERVWGQKDSRVNIKSNEAILISNTPECDTQIQNSNGKKKQHLMMMLGKKNVRFSSDIDGNPSVLTNVTFDDFVLRIIVVSLLFFSSHIRHIYSRYIQDQSEI